MNTPLVPVAPLEPMGGSSAPLPAIQEQYSLSSDLSQLTKTRLTIMVLMTTLVGYALASRGTFDWTRLLHTLFGTMLVAICSSILNQAMERDTDGLMRRTEQRPLVTRRLPLRSTVMWGLILGALGLFELTIFVNGLTAFLAALTLAVYVLAYTPLKRLTSLNTLIGAIPGALPPLMGAVAARGSFTTEGWMLFAILALWQLPHFYAIAWLYRDDYRAAGLRMVSVDDTTGRLTAWHALVFALILFPVSLLPSWIGTSGIFYSICAALFSLAFVIMAVRFVQHSDRSHARALFLTSIIYLPLLLAVLALDIPLRAAWGR